MWLDANKNVSSVIPPPPIPTCGNDDFDFYVTPRHAEFFTHKAGASRHLMVNGTNHRLAVKIKCSNNRLYRVTPVYTCLSPGRAKRLQVIRDPGGSGAQKDKLILVYKPWRHRNPRDAFLSADSGIGHEDGDDTASEMLVDGRSEPMKKTLIALVSLVDESATAVADGKDATTVLQPQSSDEIAFVQPPSAARESSAGDRLKRMMEHIRLSPLSNHHQRKHPTPENPLSFKKVK